MSASPFSPNLHALPAVDRLLRSPRLRPVLAAHGHSSVVATLRSLLDEVRARGAQTPLPTDDEVGVLPLLSQIGSGSLPVDLLPRAGLAVAAQPAGRGAGRALKRAEQALRALPLPVICRIHDGMLCLDLRCVEDEARFAAQLAQLPQPPQLQSA